MTEPQYQTVFERPSARVAFNCMIGFMVLYLVWSIVLGLFFGGAIWWLFLAGLASLIIIVAVAEFSGAYDKIHVSDREKT